ncbi:ABC-type dipeptide/oligopeptide/nickel transport system, permease component [Schinkia azotoformans MEV2011]|uniref:ABC-type dipeptide/oligopeptide/nickel transport system, permease component n=1 Tax=Schinkia azotoformans MEV2011 TaxID=1348973 RepID=A0A072NVM3_SCHAZ|nr:nickel/cobalt ABC transporter permease [Schinkia azotoformans]KEF37290.1 ABC-type dipeptide/oligopeptide/nickel transport system, permease component [Schinkia azotoformans MEV2011]
MRLIERLKKDRLAAICAGILLVIIIVGIFAPFIAPNSPIDVNVKEKLAGVSWKYPLGTDHLGRCILSRLIYGIRTTVVLSIAAMMTTILIGTLLGLLAGYFRGKVDEIIMRICDVFLSIPSEIMILAIVGILGTGLVNIVSAAIIAKLAWYTRMIRTIVIKYSDKGYIHFAKVNGLSTGHIMKKHILPGAAGEIMVLATLDTGSVILTISALSFLGLGVQAPTPEWGMMLNEAKNMMTVAPLQMLFPGLAIVLVVAAFNFLGDSIQTSHHIKGDNRSR